jgi:hypothetical protein
MKVHKDFKKWCDKLKEENKALSLIEITELLIKHNSINIIKEDIKNLKKWDY